MYISKILYFCAWFWLPDMSNSNSTQTQIWYSLLKVYCLLKQISNGLKVPCLVFCLWIISWLSCCKFGLNMNLGLSCFIECLFSHPFKQMIYHMSNLYFLEDDTPGSLLFFIAPQWVDFFGVRWALSIKYLPWEVCIILQTKKKQLWSKVEIPGVDSLTGSWGVVAAVVAIWWNSLRSIQVSIPSQQGFSYCLQSLLIQSDNSFSNYYEIGIACWI